MAYFDQVTPQVRKQVAEVEEELSVKIHCFTMTEPDYKQLKSEFGSRIRGVDRVLRRCYTTGKGAEVHDGLEIHPRVRQGSSTLDQMEMLQDVRWTERNLVGLDIGRRFLKNLQTDQEGSWCLLTCGGGSSHEIGRSAYLYRFPDLAVLIDCGIKIQGGISFPHLQMNQFDLSKLDLFIISHSHADHNAMCPALFAAGYKGPVVMTDPTRTLSVASHLDYFRISSGELNFSHDDIGRWLNHAFVVEYARWIRVGPLTRFKFIPSGHILGSCMIVFQSDGHVLVHTADYNFPRTKMLPPPYRIKAHAVVTEGTYLCTDTRMVTLQDIIEVANTAIKRTEACCGNLLIPVLAIGRGQQMLYLLKKLCTTTLPIYIDGCIPEVTQIHLKYHSFLSKELDPLTFQHDRILSAKTRSEAWSKPSIIITTSGMCEAGPVLQHLVQLAPRPTTEILLSTAQLTTVGKKLTRGSEFVEVIRDGTVHNVRVAARVTFLTGLSGHATHEALVGFVNGCGPDTVVVIHSSLEKGQKALKNKVFSARRVRLLDNRETIKLW